jgi:hypothetical protein
MMIGRPQLTMICTRLERSLRPAGFVFRDVQFDEIAETLQITLDKGKRWHSVSSAQAGCLTGKTIDARLLWDVLRDLNRLGVVSPVVQLLPRERNRAHQAKLLGGNGSLRFSAKFGLTGRRPAGETDDC